MWLRQKRRGETGTRSGNKASVLDRLRPEEAQTVLRRLLAIHRELRSEVQQIAKTLLTEVEFEAVADEVEEAVRDVGLDELGGRVGKHSWGYTSPSEAAWELLEECVSPFPEDLKRRLELGLAAEALEICKGIVLGLYRVRNERGDDVLQWAPEFPAEAAAQAVATWRRGAKKKTAGKGRRRRRQFCPEFVNEFVPAWESLIDRV